MDMSGAQSLAIALMGLSTLGDHHCAMTISAKLSGIRRPLIRKPTGSIVDI
jgi:hypothetical protein